MRNFDRMVPMMRRHKQLTRIVAATFMLAALLVSVMVVRASPGGNTKDSLTYAGTLSGVGAGQQTFGFVFHKGATTCNVFKTASVAASGAFAVTFSSVDATCITGFFDGSDVTVDVN